ncbi:MAG: NAD/FAD-binding protein [Herminiimonas sp.]|nr:NAD/FAD-binding protein [Herminiimonas sp.]
MKLAVVGAGIAGLSCAWRLAGTGHDVTLFEANDYFGGHTHTVDVELDGFTHGVDTGFLVFNHKTYPNLVALFAELQIETAATDMSFSVKHALPSNGRPRLEWSGGSLDTVFAQRRNLGSPRFLRMLRDILRFNKQSTSLASSSTDIELSCSLGDFLQRHRYSDEFRDWYLLPMAGCIWSCPTAQMLAFPVSTFVRFCHNHGLLQVSDRPQWHTVRGGARQYVEKLLAAIPQQRLAAPVVAIRRVNPGQVPQVRVDTAVGSEMFDQVVIACHSDQSLRLIADPTPEEHDILAAVKYQQNRAVLHTDASVLPELRKTWSAWNYQSISGAEPRVCVHYLINKLQPLPFSTPVIVSLNPVQEPASRSIIGSFDYAHPVFDAAAVAAQSRLANVQGRRNLWFAGAWTGYGFHEDGLKSGLAVARAITRQAGMESLGRAA